jgi:hypothetical protein
MKKQILLSFSALVLLLSSCGSAGNTADPKAIADSLQQAVMPSLEGVWIMKEYVDKLDSTLSPRASWEVMDGAVLLLVNKQSAHGDSIMMGVNWNNHEGGPATILLRPGIEKNSLSTTLDNISGDEKGKVDIGFESTADGKSDLVLYQYNDQNQLIKKRVFRKVLPKQMDNDLSHGVDVLLNHKLLSGKYTVIDAAGKKQEAEFLEDGKTRGFEGHKFFNFRSDFMDSYSNVDILELYKDESSSDGFGYLAKGDTLDLFQLDSIHDKGELRYGKKLYTLLKK